MPPAGKTEPYTGEASLSGRFGQRVETGFAGWKEKCLDVTIHFSGWQGTRGILREGVVG